MEASQTAGAETTEDPTPDPDAPETPEAETTDDQTQQQEQTPASAGKSDLRPYGMFKEIEVDLSGNATAIAAQLKELAAPEAKTVVALVRVGRAVAGDPRQAAKMVGQARDLEGDYEVIADSARIQMPNVRSKMERNVSIG